MDAAERATAKNRVGAENDDDAARGGVMRQRAETTAFPPLVRSVPLVMWWGLFVPRSAQG